MKVLIPITAVGIARFGSHRLLLAGEGRRLKVFDGETNTFLTSRIIFNSQVIHGIQSRSGPDEIDTQWVVWGGRSIALVLLTSTKDEKCSAEVRIETLHEETIAADWISSVCILSNVMQNELKESCPATAIFVTSHNIIYSFNADPAHMCKRSSSPMSTKLLAYGPSSILYSAHVKVHHSGQIFVAAGTVYGEVLLWSYHCSSSQMILRAPAEGTLIRSFIGHDGSVFGVQMSEVNIDEQTALPSCMIASCSDDRTIRLWDVSDALETGSSEKAARMQEEASKNSTPRIFESDSASTRCLATITGHSSRIWGVSYLPSKRRAILISNGEDTTCQTWLLGVKVQLGSDPEYVLHAGNIYRHHIGKNVWSIALDELDDEFCMILTGGADGRILTYSIPSNHTLTSAMNVSRWAAEPSSIQSAKVFRFQPEKRPETVARRIFFALPGEWSLHRVIKSAVSTYPSGTFTGTASLVSRPVTDNLYDFEYLYIEEGRFETDKGLSIQGNRRYVYRYQGANDCITVWFVKPTNQIDVDYLFLELDLSSQKSSTVPTNGKCCEPMVIITASGYHKCVDDNYAADYIFDQHGTDLNSWSQQYTVQGPNKEYVVMSTFTRRMEQGNCLEGLSPNCKSHEENARDTIPQKGLDSFKSYCWLGPRIILCSTAHGNLLVGSLSIKDSGTEFSSVMETQLGHSHNITWDKLTHLPHFTSHLVFASFGNYTAFLGATCGSIYHFQASTSAIKLLVRIPGKIGGLWVQRVADSLTGEADVVTVIASVVGDRFAYFATFNEDDLDFQKMLKLRLQHGLLVTSACFLASQNIIVLGSRNGGLTYYNISADLENVVDPAGNILSAHAEDAITVIQELPKDHASSIDGSFFLTTGRGGIYAIHRVYNHRSDTQGIVVEIVHASELPHGLSIEGAFYNRRNNSLHMWGFRSTSFVVWNVTRHIEVMQVACGGSYRSWAYYPSDDGLDGGGFAWTKASKCNVFLQSQASHQILQSGGHGREIKALAVCPYAANDHDVSSYLVATGAEDTCIRISVGLATEMDAVEQFRCLGIISKHGTGIQQLQWSPDGKFLISAGGREEFYIWRIQRVPVLEIGFTCVAIGPLITRTLELRIIDFDIIALEKDEYSDYMDEYLISTVYSDSTIRVWFFSPSLPDGKFQLLITERYTTCCLMQVKIAKLGPTLYLITAGSDGCIALWPLSAAIGRRDEQYDSSSQPSLQDYQRPEPQIGLALRHKIHQNSVKCCTVYRLSLDEVLLVTGGDDNAIALTRITKDSTSSSTSAVCATLLIPRAHASAVTGLKFLDSSSVASVSATCLSLRFVSAGNDQCLKTWIVAVDMNRVGVAGMSVRKELKLNSSIADASCMEAIPGLSSKSCGVMIAGIGVEQIDLPLCSRCSDGCTDIKVQLRLSALTQ
jgi:WD40 repeat protein